jgi:hypothetical protein
MLARLAPIVILLAAACLDDPGWSRDELPQKARVALMVTASSPAPCMPWDGPSGEAVVTLSALDTAAPSIVVVAGGDACAWSGDALDCDLTRGPVGTMRIDFGGEAARMDIPGSPACFTEYAITAIAAIP